MEDYLDIPIYTQQNLHWIKLSSQLLSRYFFPTIGQLMMPINIMLNCLFQITSKKPVQNGTCKLYCKQRNVTIDTMLAILLWQVGWDTFPNRFNSHCTVVWRTLNFSLSSLAVVAGLALTVGSESNLNRLHNLAFHFWNAKINTCNFLKDGFCRSCDGTLMNITCFLFATNIRVGTKIYYEEFSDTMKMYIYKIYIKYKYINYW